MKNLNALFLFIGTVLTSTCFSQPIFCDTTGNVIIFSNYDGGILRIDIDQNIPNLKIGIVSYEDDSVIISGAFAGNVTQVIYAGYSNSSSVHCTTDINVKGVYGVSSSIVTINFMPLAGYSNPNGDPNIICNYSCSTTTNQGGCNTPDQVVYYFLQQFSSNKLLFHYTQYGCWTGTYSVSSGGNCCAMPNMTAVSEEKNQQEFFLYPNPTTGEIMFSGLFLSTVKTVEVYSALGNKIISLPTKEIMNDGIDLSGSPNGIYSVRFIGGEEGITKNVIVSKY